MAELVEQSVEEFSNKNQTIFFRFILDGEAAEVVAGEVGLSPSGVYTAAHRIRQRLSKVLVEAGYE